MHPYPCVLRSPTPPPLTASAAQYAESSPRAVWAVENDAGFSGDAGDFFRFYAEAQHDYIVAGRAGSKHCTALPKPVLDKGLIKKRIREGGARRRRRSQGR